MCVFSTYECKYPYAITTYLIHLCTNAFEARMLPIIMDGFADDQVVK